LIRGPALNHFSNKPDEASLYQGTVAVKKDLGICISQDLSWSHHVEIISSRAQNRSKYAQFAA